MVNALRRNKSIVVAAAELLPPEPAEIAEVERALGFSLGDAIGEFYQACGGIKLVWTPKDPDEDGIWSADQATEVAQPLSAEALPALESLCIFPHIFSACPRKNALSSTSSPLWC